MKKNLLVLRLMLLATILFGAGAKSLAQLADSVLNNMPISPALTTIAIHLLATDENDTHSVDAVRVVFDNKYSYGLGDEDSYKFINEGENISIRRYGKLLSIEGLPLVSGLDSLPLHMTGLQAQRYSLKITGSGFLPLIAAVLRDNYLNTEIPVSLSSTTVIPFHYDLSSFSSDRFSIFLKNADLLPVTLTNVRALQREKGAEISWSVESEAGVEKYEVEKSADGNCFGNIAAIPLKKDISSFKNYTFFDANINATNNFYRVKIIEKSGDIKYSNVAKLSINRVKGSLSIYPNPIEGSVVGLHMNNFEKGSYNITLYNNFGQSVYKGMVEHKGGAGTYNLFISSKIIAGIYNLHISKGESAISTRIIIE